MASTTRKVKEKRSVAKAQEAVAEPVKEKVAAYPATLHPDHLRQLEVISRDVENARLLMLVEEQSLRNMLLEATLLQQKIDKQKSYVREKSIFYTNSGKQFEAIKSELWPQYGFNLSEGLGYDPITGEIKK